VLSCALLGSVWEILPCTPVSGVDAITLPTMAESPQMEQQSVIRVREALSLLGARGEVRALDDSARTAKEAAAALGIVPAQIANSLIFMADGAPVLVMASGGHKVDLVQLAAVLEVNDITKADADQVRDATGFAIGGVAPVGHPEPLRTIVDIALSQFDEVWAAAGHPHYVFPTSYDELLRITAGQAAEIGA
jgi:prolyl-tRNA editing enzyme YbaK/EbsC (Cys-tRNA(Pro) deacylase)